MSETTGQPAGLPQEPHPFSSGEPVGSSPAPAHRAGSFGPTDSEPDATRDVAADEARGVAQDAKASGQQVAATAKDQAAQVADEARGKTKEVLDQARRELTDQASSQHKRAAGGLHSLADELQAMSSGTERDGVASDLARQASSKARDFATWLESREPGDVLDEARRFARQRPGTFLAGAALLGLVGGRLTRGLADEARDDTPTPGDETSPSHLGTGTPPVPPTPAVPPAPAVPSTATGQPPTEGFPR